jgi:hypothetical protein
MIDGMRATRDLRLHVAGDSPTEFGTQLIAAAAARYVRRGEKQGKSVRVWAYTHTWRDVGRRFWGEVSVLASVESVDQVYEAAKVGYASAIVLPVFPTFRAFTLTDYENSVRVIPCPAQTRKDISCTDCRLCFNSKRLEDAGLTIGFEVHGQGRKKATAALKADPVRTPLPMM